MTMSVTALKKAKRIKSIAFPFVYWLKEYKNKNRPRLRPRTQIAGLVKKDLSDSPGEVDLFAGKVSFKAYLTNGQVSRQVIL